MRIFSVVLYDGRDKPLQGVQVLYKTVDGESANLNASLFPNYPVYLTFRRIDKISMLYHYEPCAISYIGLLIGVSEDDQLPLTYVKFSRNLNKGAIGFSVYLFYRKMIIKHHRLTLKPKVLYTYPKETDDQTHTFDIEAISGFCFPLDAHIEACDTSDYTDPSKLSKSKFNSFVLKGINGDKIYGYTLIVYEVINAQDIIDKYREYLSENTFIPSSQCTTFRATKCLCLLTKLPLPEVMRSLLSLIQKQLDNTFLTDTSCNGNIFRYLRHLFEDLPMLSKSCHNLYFQYERPINLSLPDEMINAGIQSAGNISFLLGLIGIENLLNTFTIIILEGKLLVHSFSSNILVTAVESISRLIFPLQWQCAYIPSCPLNFSKVFESPVPFIAGINSSYFQTNAMPNDVACLDLDYSRLCWARQDFSITWKHLPSRFVKLLRGRILQTSSDFRNFISNTNKRSEYVFAKLKKELSLREAFIQFMASILLDYRMYVSKSDGITLQSQECFNQRRFIQNIPFHSAEFFLSVIQTQAFNRFIEETFDPSNIPQSHVLFDAFLTKIHDATMMSTDSVTVSSGLFSIKSSNNANFTTVVMLPPDLQSNGVSHMQRF
ncbi:hypothetical protein GJ496_000420 [Pomphorhynchus laevis]|nr:hypothetical protein GJ496_000420 [Pomphorhynchus laevis]